MAPTASPSSIDRARKIKIILFDVDGVWTDGTIWLVPSGPSGGKLLDEVRAKDGTGFGVDSKTLVEAKGYSAHDLDPILLLPPVEPQSLSTRRLRVSWR